MYHIALSHTLFILFRSGRLTIVTIYCKCWKYVFNIHQQYIRFKIHISSTCIFGELNGHPIRQDSSLSTFQCHSQAHVPDLAVSYSPTVLKPSEVHISLVWCPTGMNTGVYLQACICFYLADCWATYLKDILHICILSVCTQPDFSAFFLESGP